MKTIRIALTLAFLTLTFFQARAGSGSHVGSGGDTYSSEFVSTAYGVLQRLSEHPIEGVEVHSLAQAILQTKVSSGEQLILNGQEVDAINYPQATPARIEVSRNRWDQIKNDEYRKWRLVLHEYLSIMKIDDRNYQVSRKLDDAEICERSTRAAIEAYFNGIGCQRLTKEDLKRMTHVRGNFSGTPKRGDFAFMDPVSDISLAASVYADITIPAFWFEGLIKSSNTPVFNLSNIGTLDGNAFAGQSGPNAMIEMNPKAMIRNRAFAQSEFTTVSISRMCSNDQPATIEAGAFNGLKVYRLYIDPSLMPSAVPADFFTGIEIVDQIEVNSAYNCEINQKFPVYAPEAFQNLSMVRRLVLPIHFKDESKTMFSYLENVQGVALHGLGLEKLRAEDLQKLTHLKQLQIIDQEKELNPDLKTGLEKNGFTCYMKTRELNCIKNNP